LLKLSRFLKPYWKEAALGSFLKLVEAFLELLLPLYMADIIDVGIANGDSGYIWAQGWKMALFSVIGLGAVFVCQYYASVTSCKVAADLRAALLDKVSSFSYKELNRFGTPTLINRMTTDVNQVRDAIALLIRLVTRAPFMCIGAIIMGIYVDPGMSIIFFAVVFAFAAVLGVLMKKTVPLFKKVQRSLDRAALILRENLSGIRVIRALARQDMERQRAEKATDDLSEAYIRVSNITNLVNPFTILIMNAGIIAVLYFGGYKVNAGALQAGSVVALTNYVTQIMLALIVVSNLVTLFTKASASAHRISEVLETNSTIIYPETSRLAAEPLAPAVEFKNVSFSYLNDEPAISGISFLLPKESILGIIGPTGSGKTTVVDLIARFYDVTSGVVSINGIDVKAYSKHQIIDKLGIVPQRSVLFTGTVAENIRYGKQDATEDEIIQALRVAQAYDFISQMPDGIHAHISQGGRNLSGGQRQRLAIARALVKNPEILILDDSLSALDYRTDLTLRAALRKYYKHTTTIIVSQRVSSISSADQILVLEGGQAVGLGTHDELLNACATYQEIYQTQTDLDGKEGVI